MKEGPVIAQVAALLGDPARANMLSALMDGRALTVSELAMEAGVTLQTASGHLAKLTDAALLSCERQGRHRYYRLSGLDVAQVLEALMGLAQRTGAVRVRTGPRDEALRTARVCYDHLAGEWGVKFYQHILAKGLIASKEEPAMTGQGRKVFLAFGLDIDALERGRRPLCLNCLDWSERRHHLAGALGAALLTEFQERKWLRPEAGRVLKLTPKGLQAFSGGFGLS
jgi:DNA-binding transcriptional ArsR family regulator